MKTKLVAILILLGLMGTANADLIALGDIQDGETYKLGNHPDDAIADPLYGLRLDGLLGDASKKYTFNFEVMGAHMTLVKTGSTVTISGTAWGGEDTGSSYSGAELWTINFTYTDMGTCGTWCANTGTGTISGTHGVFDLTSKKSEGADGFAFRLGDHRGYETSGWGWLNHCITEDGQAGMSSCGTHYAASDWLFTVHTKVSEPSTLMLLGLGLAGMGFVCRRRRIA